jgi:hypothetical protein
MQPKEFFNRKIIGKLITRKIDNLYLDGIKSQIDEEKEYDVLDIIEQDSSGKIFVVNEWCDEANQVILIIHNNFVKHYEEVKNE